MPAFLFLTVDYLTEKKKKKKIDVTAYCGATAPACGKM